MTRAIHGIRFSARSRENREALSTTMQFIFGALIVLLLTSAFSVTYLKDLSRRLFIQDQRLAQVQEHREIVWNKLLLEKGAWSTQSRIQTIATKQLNMVMPTMKHIVLVEAPQK